MPISALRRVARRVLRRTRSWGTIVALTLRGNRIERKANLRHCKNPVLLLYGFGATRRTFSILERRLYNDGYTVFSINLGGIFGTFNTHAIQDLAAYVDEKIERLYKKYDFRGKLSIISHSKGGLIGAYYVKRLGGDRRVKLLITLGAPHNGNPWALLALFSPAVFIFKSLRQMTPMSTFLKRLKQGPFPKRVKLYSIYSKDDHVSPYPCSVVDEASNVKNVEVEGVSHSEFLIRKNVYNVIKHALNDEMPVSLEEWTRKRVQESATLAMRQRSRFRLIEGSKGLAFGKTGVGA